MSGVPELGGELIWREEEFYSIMKTEETLIVE